MLKKAKNRSLVEDVTRQIEGAILAGEYTPGDKLPAMRELQEILGASIGTIRESLAILVQKGLIEVRKGVKGGFFIRKMTAKPMAETLEMLMRYQALTPQELYEFRANVEGGLIRLVVRKADAGQLQHLTGYLVEFEACLDQGKPGWKKFIDLERQFRTECVELVGNRTYKVVLTPIINNLGQYACNTLPVDDQTASDVTRQAYSFWVKIMPAIARRDGEGASKLIEDLLYHFMNLVTDSLRRMKNEKFNRP